MRWTVARYVSRLLAFPRKGYPPKSSCRHEICSAMIRYAAASLHPEAFPTEHPCGLDALWSASRKWINVSIRSPCNRKLITCRASNSPKCRSNHPRLPETPVTGFSGIAT
uniref:Uncharacterized protein n=1 Tax=Pseudomonas viridiflava TaxID=33069 RepID=I6LCI5_PSEVI|nr:hypothetical protein [Pseudomonas viridiflava]